MDAAGAGVPAQVLSYAATFLVGGIIGALTAIATFRSSIAVLERADRDRERELGELRGAVERVGRDINGVANKFAGQLARVAGLRRATSLLNTEEDEGL